ncbi:hypothetical protein [Hydrogenophaga sp. OTU3427]|uniref:hypothetical protein n=1 Tax=Hydrogenophaga sp. OTU3427 TaxID=3043856 RepID=UPI00313AA668
MADRFGSRVVTLVRGEALRESRNEPLQMPTSVMSTSPGASCVSSENQSSIYGVPVSAIQHCCGRGCKHCRIYWHGKKT